MANTIQRATWLCLLSLWACSSGGDDGANAGGNNASGGRGTGTAAAGNGSSGGAGSSSSSSAGSGASGSGASGSGASGRGADAGAAGAGGNSSPGGECVAAAGSGAPTLQCNALSGTCGGCMADKCCDLVELCSVDADCACMAMCIARQSLAGVDGCLDTCGVAGSPRGFADLANCVATTCPDGDECSVPSRFMVPPDVAAPSSTSNASIGSGMLADCSFDPGLAYNPNGSILQLESADGSLCARIERRNDGPGSLANTSFTLLSILVGPLGEVVQLDSPADVCWYSSHHNFNDWAHAWSGSRHYDLKMARADHGVAPTYALHVFEQGPLDAGSCPPTSEGTCRIGDAIELLPVNP